MVKPKLPADEQRRLKDLRDLNILDTEAEERFDRLTRLAKRVMDVPIALVSLVDENRQWFKSRVGLDACETPRDISFCGHAILRDEIFVIENALDDIRFADNPLVTGPPDIRFYAGVPLRYLSGSKLGTLCVIDRKPRRLEPEDYRSLRDLGEMAESEINAFHLAIIDELTGIANRRGFISLAQNSLSLCAREQVPVSLVYFDLNKFKPINDRFGHAEGDRALAAFAYLMGETFRDSDVYGRLGGDEFAVLLTNAPARHADQTVERFRERVEIYNREANRGYEIRFSEGIVSLQPDRDNTVDDLLERADRLMYGNKTGETPMITRAEQSRRAGG